MTATAVCPVCPEPVVLADEHLTVTRQLESSRTDPPRVLAGQVLAHFHTGCVDRLTATAVTPERGIVTVLDAAPVPARPRPRQETHRG